MKKLFWLTLLIFLLSGCTFWMDGSYHSASLYREEGPQADRQAVAVDSYEALRDALVQLVEEGAESATFAGDRVDESFFRLNMPKVIRYVRTANPIGAYAVENIEYEQGTGGGVQAVSVEIHYNRNHAQIRKMVSREGMQKALAAITDAMDECAEGIVLRVTDFSQTDILQQLQDHAEENPRLVMEMPQITVNTYPESGSDRVVEVLFSYQNSREVLRSMQNYVVPVFDAAKLYVHGDTAPNVKYSQLYTFLMERFPCLEQTSITPSYSLLRYGVGDSKAFAQVYAAMCREAQLECQVVSGTYNAEARFWNMVCVDGLWYHLDLLRCDAQGSFTLYRSEELTGYVWDFEAYPDNAPTEQPSEPVE